MRASADRVILTILLNRVGETNNHHYNKILPEVKRRIAPDRAALKMGKHL
jgi:hypothetical protein